MKAIVQTLRKQLGPAWFDEGRSLIQLPVFERLLASVQFKGHVLNAGCGEGLYAPLLEGFAGVTEITNLDVSQPIVARTRSDRRHRDVQGSLTHLPFDAETFDACLCTEVLEHIPDDAKAASELARCLKPGGFLLLSVPTPPAPKDPAHVREGYGPKELTRLLSEAGFVVEDSAYCLHGISRTLYRVWSAQKAALRRNCFPRVLLRAAARADGVMPIGQPWDLVVLARKQ
jgi:SAM-dependent methyltransferase